MKVQCQVCKYVFDDETDPEGVLVPYIGLPQVTCPKCVARLRMELDATELDAMKLDAMNCPSCDCKEVATTWVQHRFPYGEDGVMLSTQVPMRTCLHCSGKWLDHVGEDIITKAIANHLSTEKS